MSAPHVSPFLQNLRASGLLDESQLQQVEQWPSVAKGDDRTLVRELVAKGLLTKFQAEHVWAGRTQGFVIGPYVLLDRIGGGGMGRVYKALHRQMQRVVAIKVLARGKRTDPNAQARFLREVRATSQLNHPNIVAAYDVGESGDVTYLVMEYVDGPNLYEFIKSEGKVAPAQAVKIARQVALALEHARDQGIVHRDIKPSNILIDEEGTAKVLDMGLARFEHGRAGVDDSTTITRDGVVMGTLDYLAPEQALDSHQADTRADIYSLGCTLYHLLSGRVPFPGGTAAEKLMRHQVRVPPPLEDLAPDVPRGLGVIVAKMMAKKVEDRYQTPAEVTAVLSDLLAGKPVAAPLVLPDEIASPTESYAVDLSRDGDESAESPVSVIPGPTPSDEPAPAPTPSQSTPMPSGASVVPPSEVPAQASSTERAPHDTSPSAGPTAPVTPEAGDRWVMPLVLIALAPTAITLVVLTALGAVRLARRASARPLPPREPVGRTVEAAPRRVLPQGTFTNGIGMTMVRIQPGRFDMGSVAGQADRQEDEGPSHQVRLRSGFHVSAHEVTQAQYQRVMGQNPSRFSKGGDFPVEGVSWADAQAFCTKLSEEEGRRYRLPTEAQWEYACRAGGSTRFASGDADSDLDAYGWHSGNAEKATHSVGQKRPNAWGLYDMHGNVYEWCQDWYAKDYYGRSPGEDPSGPDTGSTRVVRGGSWKGGPAECRSANRGSFDAGQRSEEVGFRVVCVDDAPAAESDALPADLVGLEGGAGAR